MVNYEAYRYLVDVSCKLNHNNKKENDKYFVWCKDCNEINLWTYWQGKDSKDVKIMVVGQDWGNPGLLKNEQTMANIKNNGSYFYNSSINSENVYPTDRNLSSLFEHLGYKDIISNKYDDLFFTNFYLKYRTDKIKETGYMSRTNMMRDKDNFKELVADINPKIIICLGKLTYECVVEALDPTKKIRIKNISEYCDLIEEGKNITEIGDIGIFGMVHCGATGVNINRKKGSKADKDKRGIELMIDDWEKVSNYIREKSIELDTNPKIL